MLQLPSGDSSNVHVYLYRLDTRQKMILYFCGRHPTCVYALWPLASGFANV